MKGCGTWYAYPFFISFFLINAIVILDLSIGVFISALSDVRKLNYSIFNKGHISEFKDLWAQYDPNATGWITTYQYLFLNYEMSYPCGLGKIKEEHESSYPIDQIYTKLFKENEYVYLQSVQTEDNNLHPNEIKMIEKEGDVYWINSTKSLAIKDTRTASMVSGFQVPVYSKFRVRFRDCLKQCVNNAFSATGEQYQPEYNVLRKFEKRWKKKRNEPIIKSIDLYMAGRLMFNKVHSNQKIQEDKFNDKISVNDAMYHLDHRDRLERAKFKPLSQKNPFNQENSISSSQKSNYSISSDGDNAITKHAKGRPIILHLD